VVGREVTEVEVAIQSRKTSDKVDSVEVEAGPVPRALPEVEEVEDIRGVELGTTAVLVTVAAVVPITRDPIRQIQLNLTPDTGTLLLHYYNIEYIIIHDE
tara:strand:+ start:575 stop:874 length:300 start_codon:yes stop_codon:yes gene_type:complete